MSEQSLETLIQWLYMSKVKYDLKDDEDLTEHISAIIEFVRLADMCGVTGMESQMAQHVDNVLVVHQAPRLLGNRVSFNNNTFAISSEHIFGAESLPKGHPVRCVLAKVSVKGFLQSQNYKFASEVDVCPKFASDLLGEVRCVLKTVKPIKGYSCFQDPIAHKWFKLHDFWGDIMTE